MRKKPEQRRYRIVLADDQPEVRQALHTFMDRDGRFEVIAEAETGAEAIAIVASERPDAVVLDLAMPDVDGLEALGRIMQEMPATRVVVLSGMVQFNDTGSKALSAGAVAAFDKYTSPRKVIKALARSLSDAPAAVRR